ncbi:MAG: glutamate--tRNA ligase [Clostridiales bacterium]|jgi:glutamyl-tRNA synthetase|nr:glutamate--tRNA ligase [Clostridiales bacterium]
MIRTRFAPSPTGYMHIGNLRTAVYEYLIAKSQGGQFILRIEDTDQTRLVEGSVDVIYNTLKTAGIRHDEGPDIGGAYGPYIQSERKSGYLAFAQQLVAEKKAYYCFCDKERLDGLKTPGAKDVAKYDRRCLSLSQEEIDENLRSNKPYVIRQLIPEGQTTFSDLVYGDITVDNAELDDQILIKSDGLPTYNFANVVDDHLMLITHVVRGSEYLSSTPKYNLLYTAFGWEIPAYVHLPLVLNENGEKLSKRKGDASFEDLIAMGFLPEAIINYIALLGWSPSDNTEFFTLDELVRAFDTKGLSKSPSVFDKQKLAWMNGEYFKKMDAARFYALAENTLRDCVKTPGIEPKTLAPMVQSRIQFISEIPALLDFIDALPDYDTALYVHKKMKTTEAIALSSLEAALPMLAAQTDWTNGGLYAAMIALVETLGVKNGQMLWPVRTALSGKPSSPCGASELAELLGKEETIRRITTGIEKLKK